VRKADFKTGTISAITFAAKETLFNQEEFLLPFLSSFYKSYPHKSHNNVIFFNIDQKYYLTFIPVCVILYSLDEILL